jgi:DNA-3-methyladenine glycosylase II
VVGEAERHLAGVCKRLAGAMATNEPFPTAFERTRDPYRALVRAVTFQQLSGKAAATIHARLIALYPGKDHPEPQDILDTPETMLRGAGLSRQKIAAIRDIAQKTIEGVIPEAGALRELADAEIIDRLTAARGVGRWTVEMYLIFSLGRPDVLPVDDLGVRKGAEKLYRRKFTPQQLDAYGVRWAPHRSAAAWHFWRIADTLTPERAPPQKKTPAAKRAAPNKAAAKKTAAKKTANSAAAKTSVKSAKTSAGKSGAAKTSAAKAKAAPARAHRNSKPKPRRRATSN